MQWFLKRTGGPYTLSGLNVRYRGQTRTLGWRGHKGKNLETKNWKEPGDKELERTRRQRTGKNLETKNWKEPGHKGKNPETKNWKEPGDKELERTRTQRKEP
jgi:hypothetical protein